MATSGGRREQQSEINVTPMIDVLLVLLVIFMVVQQELRSGIPVQLPPASSSVRSPTPDPLVLSIRPGPEYALNTRPLAPGRLTEELRGIFASRPGKVLFVQADEGLRYGEVVRAMDASRAAGVEVIGVVPRARGS
ncbi:MAG TPA: biopolymer transporter ExbD [Longimicrobiaceae bacterium]|nr:biopolymer transporter ExbD [Longimicrobiaceae bacterium]